MSAYFGKAETVMTLRYLSVFMFAVFLTRTKCIIPQFFEKSNTFFEKS